MTRRLVSFIFITSQLLATLLMAEAPPPAIDLERLNHCTEFSPNPHDCIGKMAGACSNHPSAGLDICLNLERDYWIERATDTLSQLRKRAIVDDMNNGAKPGFTSMLDGLDHMHSGFEAFRDASCFKQTERSVSVPAKDKVFLLAQCLMKMDAEQALYLEWIREQGQ